MHCFDDRAPPPPPPPPALLLLLQPPVTMHLLQIAYVAIVKHTRYSPHESHFPFRSFPPPSTSSPHIASAGLARLSLGPTGRFEQCSGGCCCCYASSSSRTVRSPLPLRILNVVASSATAARLASSTAATKRAAVALQVLLAALPPSVKKCNTLPMYLYGLLQLRPSV